MNLVRDGRESLSFMEAMIESYNGTRRSYDWMWDIFFGSQYVGGLNAFFSNFSRVKVLWYEEMFLEPQTTINDLTEFLHLERHNTFDPYLRLSVSGRPVNSVAKFLLSREGELAYRVRQLIKRSMPKKLSYGLANRLLKPKRQFSVNTEHPLILKLDADFEESKNICHEHLSS